MARFQCDHHGRQGAVIACPHVVQAIKDGAQIGYSVAQDKRLLGGELLCTNCVVRWGEAASDTEFERLASELKGVCGKCFDEWRTKCGGGCGTGN